MSEEKLLALNTRIEDLEKRLKNVEMRYVRFRFCVDFQKDEPAEDTPTQALVRKAAAEAEMTQLSLVDSIICSCFFRRTPKDYYNWTLDERR